MSWPQSDVMVSLVMSALNSLEQVMSSEHLYLTVTILTTMENSNKRFLLVTQLILRQDGSTHKEANKEATEEASGRRKLHHTHG